MNLSCSTCKRVLDCSNFYKAPKLSRGFEYRCKDCCTARSRKWFHTYGKSESSKLAGRNYYERNREEVIERSAVWRKANPEEYKLSVMKHKEKDPEGFKLKQRSASLRREYGITIEQYGELLNKQNNSCAICERDRSLFDKELAVDHNKKTGEIRGLLCTDCNYRLVADHTDGSRLRQIADYIEQGTGWIVPNV